MPRVELIYLPGCPNVDAARVQIRKALALLELEPGWHERDATAPDAPTRIRGLGSPTVLVDGVDVTGAASARGPSCRVYPEGGAPPLAALVAALRASLRCCATPAAASARSRRDRA